MIILSTIIPIYNKEKALRQTLQSVIDNHEINDDEYECILVDDESTDSCSEICREFCKKYSYFKYVRIFNDRTVLPSAARNIGLKLSEGKYIHFLDADDILSKNFYKAGTDFLLHNNEDIFIRSLRIVKNNTWYVYTPAAFDNTIYCPPLQSTIFSKKCIKDVKFDIVKSNEDILFFWIVMMNNDFKFYDDRTNFDSFVYYEKFSELNGKYPGMDKNSSDKYIVEYLQNYEKYPYKLENGIIVKK